MCRWWSRSFGLHFALPVVTGISTSAFESGFIAMALQSSAYLADVARAGIQAIPKGQWDAADALGLSRTRKWLDVVLPQALKIIIPPLANIALGYFKASSVLALLSIGELTGVATRISNYTFKPIEIFTTIAHHLSRAGLSLELNDLPAGKGLSDDAGLKMSFDTSLLWQNLPVLASGVWMTLALVIVSLAIGIVIGLIICAGMLLGRGIAYYMSAGYVALFRALPEPVIIFWLYYCAPLILNTKLSAFEAGRSLLRSRRARTSPRSSAPASKRCRAGSSRRRGLLASRLFPSCGTLSRRRPCA